MTPLKELALGDDSVVQEGTFTRMAGYHVGEIQAQDKAGTRGVANELLAGRSASLSFSRNHDAFLAAQSFSAMTIVEATKDIQNVWVTPLFGIPGDITAESETEILVSPDSIPTGDFLHSVSPGTPLSLIAIDLARRIRHRINGVAGETSKGSSLLHMKVEEYSPNCPKYINRRELIRSPTEPPVNRNALRQERPKLIEADEMLIAESDTLWIGTYAPGVGADCNHRGGKPGFIRVVDGTAIEWPEYRGNGMFYTSGNLEVNDRAGVTIVDFATGTVLQLTGRATVNWNHDGSFEGATRTIRLDISHVIRTDNATSHRWKLLDYSPYNPNVADVEDENTDTVTLAKIVSETEDVKTFRWVAQRRIPFIPGQYATFEFANVPGGGSSEVRTWTLSETPNSIQGDNTLDITVKRKGLVTNWLHDQVQVGLQAKLHGVQGDLSALSFVSDKPVVKSHILLISAGIGITPMVAMVRGIGAFRLQDQTIVYMIHVERHEKDLLFQSELARRSRQYHHFQLTNVITSQEGRLTLDRIDQLLPSNTRQLQEAFLCGPIGFMTATSEYLVALGVPPDQIHTESFAF